MPLQGAEIVRIECHGCRSTLEVGVPFSCIRSAEPVVVRCGACVTLLQVRITLQPSIPNEEETFNFDGSIPSDLSHDLTLPAEHLRQLHQQSQNQQHDSGLHPEDESESMQHDIASAFAPFPKGIWQPPAQGYSNSAEPLNLDFMARCGPLRNIQSDPGISSPPLSPKSPMTDVQDDQHSQEHQPLKTKCKAAKSSANDCAINRPAAHGGVEQSARWYTFQSSMRHNVFC